MHTTESQRSPTGEQRSRSSEAARLLAAALVPLGLLASAGVEAGVGGFDPTRQSRVDGTVVPNPNGSGFLYEFTVHNTSIDGEDASGFPVPSTDQIVDWELPFFDLLDIVGLADGEPLSIESPVGWTHEILAYDPGTGEYQSSTYFNNGDPNQAYGDYTWDYDAAADPLLASNPGLYGPNPGVFETAPYILHWYTPCVDFSQPGETSAPSNGVENSCDFELILPQRPIVPGEGLPGFSFVSAYNDQNAPYLASWFREPVTSGDPPIPENPQGLSSPNSPARQAAQGINASLPAPGTALLLGAGLVAFGLRRRPLIA